MIKYSCIHCKMEMQSPEDMAGSIEICPNCNNDVKVPGEGLQSSSLETFCSHSQEKKGQARDIQMILTDVWDKKVKQYIVPILLAGILITQIVPFFQPDNVKWEYKCQFFGDLTLVSELNYFGDSGWEIESARRAKSSYTDTYGYEMLLKRRK